MSGVGYSFPVIPLSFEAAKKLQGPMTSVLLNRISFNRNFPRAVVYGPVEMGGLGLFTIYVEAGIAKIGVFMRHLSSESELGKSLTIALRATQLEAGVSWNILERPDKLPHLTDTWITALRDFMAPHDIQIKLCPTTEWKVVKTCKHDTFIMEEILQTKRYTDGELKDINRARMFFRAMTVSDIATADGRTIDPNYFTRERPERKEHSTWRWPRQPEITHKQLQLWEKAIRGVYMNSRRQLKQRLGDWTTVTHRRTKAYYCRKENLLMVRDVTGTLVKYHTHEGLGNTPEEGFDLESHETITTSETHTWAYVPADIFRESDHFRIKFRGYILPTIPTPATSFMEYAESRHPAKRRLLQGLELIHDDAIFWIRRQWETEGLLISATDGSAPADGTFGWILALPDGTPLVECSGPADGAPDQISSGRAESTGVLSIGIFMRLAAEYLEIVPGGICRNYIDSTAALNRARRAGQPQRMLRSRISSDMDLTTAYRALGAKIYGYMKMLWVKGHQDRHLTAAQMPISAKLNQRADALAEEYRENNQGTKHMNSQPRAAPVPGQKVQLIVNGFAITKSHARWIRYQITGYDQRKYLQDKHEWRNETWESIDWYGFGKAIKAQAPTMRRRITKFIHGWWNTGTQRRKINKRDFILCPRCKLRRETTDHVLHCSRLSETTQNFRKTLRKSINSITPDSLTDIIMSILRQLSREPNKTPTIFIKDTLPPETRIAIRKAKLAQQNIGWNLMLRGYLATAWTEVYVTLSGNAHESEPTQKWSKTVITCLWTYAFGMWEVRCKLLAEDEEGLKFTAIDNEIRELYAQKDKFLPVDQLLFAAPLAKILAQTVTTKESRLLGLQAAKTRWKYSIDNDPLENTVNPNTRPAITRNNPPPQPKQTKKRSKRKTKKTKKKKTPRPV